MKKARIKDVAEFVLDGTHGSPERTEQGVPVLSAQNIREGRLDFSTNRYTSLKEYESFRKRLPLKSGDVLLTIVGTIGRTAVVNELNPLVLQRSVAAIRPKASVLDPRFLFYSIQTPEFQSHLSRASNKSSQAGVYLGRLKELSIKLPPISEQRQIVEILKNADSIRRAQGKCLELCNSLSGAVFHEMFTGGEVWPSHQLESVLDSGAGGIRTGPFGSQLLHSEFVAEGIPVLGIDNVVENRFRWGARRFITLDKFHQLKRYTVRPQDVLITIMGTCGRCAIVPENIGTAINSKHLCCITPNRTLCLPEYLQGVFLWNYDVARQMASRRKGAIMDGLNMEIIRSLKIPLPPLNVQRRYVEVKRVMDACIEAKEGQVLTSQALSLALAQQLLSARL